MLNEASICAGYEAAGVFFPHSLSSLKKWSGNWEFIAKVNYSFL
jgi:hypothetical protein